jgi:Na+-driven multidrug efflux pump
LRRKEVDGAERFLYNEQRLFENDCNTIETEDCMSKKFSWNMLPVIAALAWPTMLEQLMQTAVQYIDTAMVGSLGTQATAAVGATTTINWLINGTISALGVGFLAFIARACGANDREEASRAAAQAVLAVLVLKLVGKERKV